MAFEFLAIAQQQAVALRLQLSVAHLQPSPSGFKRQEASHGMQCSIWTGQTPTQQQHPSAFGVDRLVLNPFMQC